MGHQAPSFMDICFGFISTNYQLAKWAEEGAEVKVLKVAHELTQQSVIEKNPIWKAHTKAGLLKFQPDYILFRCYSYFIFKYFDITIRA